MDYHGLAWTDLYGVGTGIGIDSYGSTKAHTERCRRKLGLATWDGDEESADTVRWTQLMQLMARSEADWTIFFRSLVSSLLCV